MRYIGRSFVGIGVAGAALLVWSSWEAGAEQARLGPAEVVAMVGGVAVSRGELDELARDELARLRVTEYDIQRRALDKRVEALLLAQEAASRGIGADELARVEIEAKAAPVAGEEVQAFYARAKDRIKGMEEAEALRQIAGHLRRERIAQRREEFLSQLRARRGVRILLEPIRIPVEAGDGPAKGPRDAPVTIVEFADFQCPACASVAPTLRQIEERYRGKVRLVFRDFPLPFHNEALKAAAAGSCAAAQGRFWEMYDRLFASQGKLLPADLTRYASELGLEPRAFGECLESSQTVARVERSRADGIRYGVGGTPAFFVNGRPLSGAQSIEGFTRIVDEELLRVQGQSPWTTKPAQ